MRKLLLFSLLMIFSVSYGKMLEITEGHSAQLIVPKNDICVIRFTGKAIKNIVIMDEKVLGKKVNFKKTIEGIIINTVIPFTFIVEFEDNDLLPVKIVPDTKCTNVMYNVEVVKLNVQNEY
jgi:hypothetical protein